MIILPQPTGPLTEEQAKLVSELTELQVAEIDDHILRACRGAWRKVAMVTALAMTENPNHVSGIPDTFYSSRILLLIQSGKLASRGNLEYVGLPEVRLAE
ncbi:MAG: hypothetical protein DHS20C11_06410 [Lysobacteraceae bacterium]|nr:MAG: hypothetical protein DHS20C11_06410 [Xanthomonadaceae bacterium]